MANPLLPPEERNLTPDQVEALDKRRDLGHTFLVIAGQFAVIATVLLLWIGQDLTYSPGWAASHRVLLRDCRHHHRRLRYRRHGSAPRHSAPRLTRRTTLHIARCVTFELCPRPERGTPESSINPILFARGRLKLCLWPQFPKLPTRG